MQRAQISVQKGKWILELYGKYGINPEWIGFGKGKMFIAERSGLDSFCMIGKGKWISRDVTRPDSLSLDSVSRFDALGIIMLDFLDFADQVGNFYQFFRCTTAG